MANFLTPTISVHWTETERLLWIQHVAKQMIDRQITPPAEQYSINEEIYLMTKAPPEFLEYNRARFMRHFDTLQK